MAQAAGDPAVEVSAEVAASPETVWRCLVRKDLLSRWLSADATLEARVGGAVRIDFVAHATVVEGVVTELDEPRRLAFTWGVARGRQAAEMPPGSTTVRISLEPAGAGTRVTLRHEGLPTEQERCDHAAGWTAYLRSLAGTVFVASVEGGIDVLWDRWFAAWNTDDAAVREDLLRRCAVDGVTFDDTWASGVGIGFLAGWIGMTRTMFPGAAIVRTGPSLQMRDALLVPWEYRMGERVLARGHNHGRIAGDGRLARVEGFSAPGP